ncbi:MAG TPA: guanylate kinase [Planctomycetaceae bacterium]|nr:guanylate kinase [Planctomycetaceae bacterium]
MSGPDGKLFIISGPSGAGKSTVLRRVLETSPVPVRLSVSATTRLPRPGEVHGRDYYFLSDEEFRRRLANGEFLEAKEVYGQGKWYGTLWDEVRSGWEAGEAVILEIDVEGAMSVVPKVPGAVTIFLHPGSPAELERRLRARRTESDAEIARRLEVARRELEKLPLYQYEVINDDVDRAAEEICGILERETRPAEGTT